MLYGECSDEGSKVGPEHREVAGKDMEEALAELILNEFDEGGRHVLLQLCLCLKTGVYFFYRC